MRFRIPVVLNYFIKPYRMYVLSGQRKCIVEQKLYRWWVAAGTGLLYGICFPPFNHTTHVLLFPFPLLSLIILLPLFFYSIHVSFRSFFLYSYIFGTAASITQYYWIGFVTANGLWPLIITGLLVGCAAFAVYFLVAAFGFRYSRRFFPRAYRFLFPSVWILIEYSKTRGEISFPWNFLGYTTVPFLPLAQSASILGVYGLSWLVVFVNILIFELIMERRARGVLRRKSYMPIAVFSSLVVALTVFGAFRLQHYDSIREQNTVRVSCIQSNIDQNNWGRNSIDTAFEITESLSYRVAQEEPDLIVMPESALLCYLERSRTYRNRLLRLADSIDIPVILGSLHWDRATDDSYYTYYVYNTAFFIDAGSREMEKYFKVKIVPFSEAMPFEGIFPILSRVNLGEADFKRGTDPHPFVISDSLVVVPYICYEIIYPGYVRSTVDSNSHLLVNITNDGWFGRSSGPFQHAAMARMRSIENGISMVRCANSGITMLVDQCGRVMQETGLYSRTTVTGEISKTRIDTLYSHLGDWPVYLSTILVGAALLFLLGKWGKKRYF
jgi:apolipoprotein N-acyltransferase